MHEPWVTIARREDLADAEREATVLRDADIAANVVEAADGTIEIQVEAENANAAQARLAKIDDPIEHEEQTAALIAPLAPDTPPTTERQYVLERAFWCATLGFILPPLWVSSVRWLKLAHEAPEPLTPQDKSDLGGVRVVLELAVLFWLFVLLMIYVNWG